jgi:ATP phosphoribosyltransferase regulatory subunit
MGKFEEYDFYARNKNFLESDHIITFTDTNGKLLALKPDVTLSIIKNCKDLPAYTQRVYYNENVYRVSESTMAYKEIMQTGLECIGAIDLYDIYEVLSLAAESLASMSDQFVLDISHVGILAGLLEEAGDQEPFRQEIIACIAGKNAHEIRRLCGESGVSDQLCERLVAFAGIYGEMGQVLEQLEPICTNDAMRQSLQQLRAIAQLFEKSPYESRIHFDFSVVNDMNYYNGIVFQGFLNGIPERILSGGQYDKLMRKLGRASGAIGFAVYLDLLDQFDPQPSAYDVDTLLLYDEQTDRKMLRQAVQMLTENGKSVSVQRAVPPRLRCRQMLQIKDRGLEILENRT